MLDVAKPLAVLDVRRDWLYSQAFADKLTLRAASAPRGFIGFSETRSLRRG